MGEIRESILKHKGENKIVFFTIDGPITASIPDFVKQPLEGVLYDLNRDEATILTLVDEDPKRVNDFALVQVLKHFESENQRLKEELEKKTKAVEKANELLLSIYTYDSYPTHGNKNKVSKIAEEYQKIIEP